MKSFALPKNILTDFTLVGRAKRAPHWGVQSRFCVIYIYVGQSVGMSFVSKKRRRNYVGHEHAQSHFWAVKTDP